MLNRSAITVTAKKPFLEWLRQLPDPIDESRTLDQINEDSSIFLLPEYDSESEIEECLKGCFEFVFDEQLNSWWTDETAWPENRDFSMFKEWFNVSFHSMVQDIVDEPLIDDD